MLLRIVRGYDQQTVDLTPPDITGTVSFTYQIGDAEPDYLTGLTANDPEDGNLTPDITVDTSDVNLTQVGVYDVIYSVLDQAGNSFSVTVQVTVRDPQQIESPDHLNIYYMDEFPGSL